MRKLHNDGQMIDVSSRLGQLDSAMREVPGLAAVYLFGSYGTEYQTPLSDVDLAFIFAKNHIPDFDAHLSLIATVTATLQEEDVSVTLLDKAPLTLRHTVLSKGRPLFVYDEIVLADFIEETLDRYLDFQVDYERFLHEYDRALVEEYGHAAG
ncbi:MAG: type VII toxin-antitoxin system MntA family adenylyltransferase antitoxin [Thermoanaerobaculia bacterium]